MPFKKGHEKKGGRTKGQSNKDVSQLRGFFYDLINDNKDKIEKDLKELTPKERLDFYLKCANHVLPKMQSIEADVRTDVTMRLNPSWIKPEDNV